LEETASLINSILEEHAELIEGTQISEGILNDIGASEKLETALDDFMPRSNSNKVKILEDLRESLERIDKELRAHFDREERALLGAFEKQGRRILVSALRVLFTEHQELKNRLAKLRQDASELATGKLSRGIWEGTAYGMRAYMSHTRKLLEAHAGSEEELFQRLQKETRGT